MTIKRQLFLSNIYTLLTAIGCMAAIFVIARVAIHFLIGSPLFQEHPDVEWVRKAGRLFIIVCFIAFFTVFSIINSIITNRKTKRIIKPLDILSGGVRQIQENNFACRIEYDTDDEFRPVCEAFNQMAAQLEASSERRMKDEANRRELLAGISHDLRTPLTTIDGYLDGIESGVASTPEMREKYLHTIKNRTSEMKHIIEQLFLFSKLDMDEFPFSPRHFNVSRALSDMVEELADDYAMRGLEIAMEAHCENVMVHADVSHFRRVLINILENSVKYKEKETGRMNISVSVDNGIVQIIFSDDGPGVNPDALPNLFNAFYRSDHARNTKGSGLGLAISAKIIERSGGTIHAEGSAGGGLAVVIRLPVTTGAA
ncbi:MAG: HAMP domain-containing histidine kinase [Treponema sp.]|nr:HAMP domain-containing histidine kinase [Treponema sp.]